MASFCLAIPDDLGRFSGRHTVSFGHTDRHISAYRIGEGANGDARLRIAYIYIHIVQFYTSMHVTKSDFGRARLRFACVFLTRLDNDGAETVMSLVFL